MEQLMTLNWNRRSALGLLHAGGITHFLIYVLGNNERIAIVGYVEFVLIYFAVVSLVAALDSLVFH